MMARDYYERATITIEAGLDLILSHFEEPVWPRTISTKSSEGGQVKVYNKQEALGLFKQAKFIDCKINGYPNYTEWSGINRQAPNFIFIDLDLFGFISRLALDRALQKTLNNVKQKLGNDAQPTVLWSGNGYHIYLPVQAFILESESLFAEFDQTSRKFIQFAELGLSNKKADQCHSNGLSFKNCMLRIPGSYNSKQVEFSDRGEIVSIPYEAEVRIIQRWNRVRPIIKPLLTDFYLYLEHAKIKETEQRRQAGRKRARWLLSHPNQPTETTKWLWVETLLQIPIGDYRKNAVRLIIAPYLLNIRKLYYEEAFNIAKDWLNLCGSTKRLDFNSDRRIKENLNNALKVGYRPIGFEKLRIENRQLHTLLCEEMHKYSKTSSVNIQNEFDKSKNEDYKTDLIE
jgi:hypothetical protein